MNEYLRPIFSVHKCVACRSILSREVFDESFCPTCHLAWQVAKTESCPECYRAATECTCMPKLLSSAGALTLRRLFFYSPKKEKEAQNRLVYYIKHNKSRRASRFVASEISKPLLSEMATLGIKAESLTVLGVPRGRKAVRAEGFDQSALVARALAREIGAEYAPLIKRRFGTKEQKKLSAAQRRKNLANSMYLAKRAEEKLRGRYVALFDDIVTTGASMAACLPLLRRAGVKGVICLAIASDLKKELSK